MAKAFVLNTGAKLPAVGLGTWKAKPGEVGAAVKTALGLGYRHVDCAFIYKNESEVGAALRESFSAGPVRRDDIFVTTKLWCDAHADADVERACRDSLSKLGLESVDLYLVHWPCVTGCQGPSLDPPLSVTWAAMEALVAKGLAKAIGVSNVSAAKLESLLASAKIVPAVNQVEMHPLWRQDALLAYCKSKGIHVTAYSPLGSPDSVSFMGHKDYPAPLKSPAVLEMAARLGKSPAQVLLAWGVQRGTSVIPKSTHATRLAENLGAAEITLGDADMAVLNSLPQKRLLQGRDFLSPTGPYKSYRDLWDEDEPV